MPNLDWKKHDAEIVGFVKETTNFYLRTEASTGKLLKSDQGILLRNNYATPLLMMELLKYLSSISEQVDDKLQSVRTACLVANMDLEECVAGSSTFGPIFRDYEEWVARLEVYYAETAAAIERNPDASGDEDEVFWDTVTRPLLLGLYPGKPGQRRLDAVTPIILAWQIEVVEEAYAHAREHFWKDLKEQAGIVYEQVTGWGAGLALLAVAGLALGYGYGKGK